MHRYRAGGLIPIRVCAFVAVATIGPVCTNCDARFGQSARRLHLHVSRKHEFCAAVRRPRVPILERPIDLPRQESTAKTSKRGWEARRVTATPWARHAP